MATQKMTATAQNEPQAPPLSIDERLEEARSIVKSNVRWAAGIGLVPVPIVDMLGITTVQIRMLKKMSDLYGIPFMEHKVKNLLASLIVGTGSVKLGLLAMGSVLKIIPGVGGVLSLVTIPIVGGALTHATGQVFISHFESGGNFLDFKPEEAREHFNREFESAQDQLKSEKQTAAKKA